MAVQAACDDMTLVLDDMVNLVDSAVDGVLAPDEAKVERVFLQLVEFGLFGVLTVKKSGGLLECLQTYSKARQHAFKELVAHHKGYERIPGFSGMQPLLAEAKDADEAGDDDLLIDLDDTKLIKQGFNVEFVPALVGLMGPDLISKSIAIVKNNALRHANNPTFFRALHPIFGKILNDMNTMFVNENYMNSGKTTVEYMGQQDPSPHSEQSQELSRLVQIMCSGIRIHL